LSLLLHPTFVFFFFSFSLSPSALIRYISSVAVSLAVMGAWYGSYDLTRRVACLTFGLDRDKKKDRVQRLMHTSTVVFTTTAFVGGVALSFLVLSSSCLVVVLSSSCLCRVFILSCLEAQLIIWPLDEWKKSAGPSAIAATSSTAPTGHPLDSVPKSTRSSFVFSSLVVVFLCQAKIPGLQSCRVLSCYLVLSCVVL
jgi:hypothetical protein